MIAPEVDVNALHIEKDAQEENTLHPGVQEIFDHLRAKPFRNADQRQEMVSYLNQLLIHDDVPEVRVFFRELGKLLNDLGDNGKIDGSSNEVVESMFDYTPVFAETAEKFGIK